MKLATKLLMLLLAALLCIGSFASCSCDTVTTTTTTTDGSEAISPPEDGGYRNRLLDDKTYEGKTCTIYYKQVCGPSTSLYIEDPGISALDRAAYRRLQSIGERSGVKIVGIESSYDGCPGNTGDIEYLRNLFSSNDPENIPDIVMPGGYATSILAGEGVFLDLAYENPYIDLSMDCWDHQVNDALSVCGTYYGVSGLFTVSNVKYTNCVYVDKDALATIDPTVLDTMMNGVASDFENMDTLYEWARSGAWTYPKMLALSAAFAGESGAIAVPGKWSVGDKYGLEYQGTSSYSIFMATGKKYVAPDAENYGIPKVMLRDIETINVLNWLIDNVQTKPYVNVWGGDTGAHDFGIGRHFGLEHSVLFNVWLVEEMAVYSALGGESSGATGDFNYGVLPMPKFDYADTMQDNYYGAMLAWWGTLACIPKNCADTAFSSFVLQLITEMGYYPWGMGVTTVWDAYVIDGLHGKYAPDTQDEEMLELVLDSMISDLGEYNVFADVNVANSIRDMYRSANKNWSGWCAQNEGPIHIAIEDMLFHMGLLGY